MNTYTKTPTHHPQIALGLELQKARAQIRILSLLPDGGNDARGHSEESDWPSHVDPLSVGVCIPIRVCLRVCVCVWIYVYMYVSTRDSCIFYICLIWTSHLSLYAHFIWLGQYMSLYAYSTYTCIVYTYSVSCLYISLIWTSHTSFYAHFIHIRYYMSICAHSIYICDCMSWHALSRHMHVVTYMYKVCV